MIKLIYYFRLSTNGSMGILQGPEQNALGNLLVLFLLSGVFGGAAGSWLWLIGKGW